MLDCFCLTQKKSVCCRFPVLFLCVSVMRCEKKPTNDDNHLYPSKIVYCSSSSGAFHIYTMNPDGSDVTQLTFGQGEEPQCWSPDGSKIAFICEDSTASTAGAPLYIMDADGTNMYSLKAYAELMSWSPDGSRLVFSLNQDIFVINVDGSNKQRLPNDAARDYDPDWSPDGSKIVFVSNRFLEKKSYATEIYLMNQVSQD